MNLINGITAIRDGLISVGYPSACRLCGSSIESWSDGVACRRCWEDREITWIFDQSRSCSKCGLPLSFAPIAETDQQESGDRVAQSRGRLCGLCGKMAISAARSCADYSGAIQASILFLKTAPHICPRLRQVIEETLKGSANSLASDVIVPIPLHPVRRRERGFNQAALVARLAAKAFRAKVDERILERTRQTRRHRAGMDPVDRARSVQKAFRLREGARLDGKSFLIVDDVYTTGSTVTEAARALLDGGASTVNCFTIARVVLPKPVRRSSPEA